MVSILDCPLRHKDWTDQVNVRDGICQSHPVNRANGTDEAGAWGSAVNAIRGFQSLADDWDGFGAKAPARELINSAIGLALLLNEKGVEPPIRVAPGIEGTVLFEWQGESGFYADVEVVRPFHAEVMLVKPGEKAKHWTLPTE